MSSKKPASDPNKARLAALKKLGILKDIPARGNLTDKQKQKVRNEFKKYHAVANAAPGAFKKIDVSRLSKSDINALKKSGYPIAGTKAFIPTEGYKKASITQSWSKDEDGNPIKNIEVRRWNSDWKDDRKKQADLIGKPTEKMQWQERLAREYQAGKFREGDFIGVKVFDRGRFERHTVLSLDEIYKYVPEVRWHDPDKAKMLDNLHLVKISVSDYRDLADRQSDKEKSHNKYIASKNRKATKTLRITDPEKLRSMKAKKVNKSKNTKITGRKKK